MTALRFELGPALAAFSGLVDDEYGVVRDVTLVRPSPGAPEVFVAHAAPSSTLPLVGIDAANQGAAASVSSHRAVVRACGESVERYCSAFFDREAMPLVTAEELEHRGQAVIRSGELYPFAPAQYAEPGFPFDPADGLPQRWVPVRDHAGRSAWAPASCVYVPYLFDREEEPFTHMPISTGLAAGPTYEACVEKGVLEVLERDALMTRWLHELPAPAVDPETCRGVDPLLDASLSAGEGTGASGTARWHLNLITVDIPVPVVTAALIDDEGDPMTSMGVAAHRDPVRALLLAVEEALLTRVLLSRASELRGVTSPPTEATTLRGHMLAHACDPELRRGLDRVIGSGRVLPLPAVVARFRASSGRPLAALLGGAGLTAWSVDLTTPDVAAVGLSVARTLVPGLQPLDNDHRHRHLGGRRLASVPAALGVPGRPLDDLNPLPHPFP